MSVGELDSIREPNIHGDGPVGSLYPISRKERTKRPRNLRACLLCGLTKSGASFSEDGCDNCEDVLDMRGSKEKVGVCTSSNFTGAMFLTIPRSSFLAQMHRVNHCHPGQYALSISGTLPQHIIDDLKRKGVTYVSRCQNAPTCSSISYDNFRRPRK
ncbi:hypothetical protein ACOME3_009915 [Neoechinorhynchus agilis]